MRMAGLCQFYWRTCSVYYYSSLFFLLGSVRQSKLANRQFFSASVSNCIVPYRLCRPNRSPYLHQETTVISKWRLYISHEWMAAVHRQIVWVHGHQSYRSETFSLHSIQNNTLSSQISTICYENNDQFSRFSLSEWKETTTVNFNPSFTERVKRVIGSFSHRQTVQYIRLLTLATCNTRSLLDCSQSLPSTSFTQTVGDLR